jgi:hypothetical protein
MNNVCKVWAKSDKNWQFWKNYLDLKMFNIQCLETSLHQGQVWPAHVIVSQIRNILMPVGSLDDAWFKIMPTFVKNEFVFYQMCDVHNFSIIFDTMMVWVLMLLTKNALSFIIGKIVAMETNVTSTVSLRMFGYWTGIFVCGLHICVHNLRKSYKNWQFCKIDLDLQNFDLQRLERSLNQGQIWFILNLWYAMCSTRWNKCKKRA